MVNFCFVSAERKGIIDPDCVTNKTQIFSYLNNTRVSSKYVRQFFNPETILETGFMEYIGEQRMESDFVENLTPTNYLLSQ